MRLAFFLARYFLPISLAGDGAHLGGSGHYHLPRNVSQASHLEAGRCVILRHSTRSYCMVECFLSFLFFFLLGCFPTFSSLHLYPTSFSCAPRWASAPTTRTRTTTAKVSAQSAPLVPWPTRWPCMPKPSSCASHWPRICWRMAWCVANGVSQVLLRHERFPTFHRLADCSFFTLLPLSLCFRKAQHSL